MKQECTHTIIAENIGTASGEDITWLKDCKPFTEYFGKKNDIEWIDVSEFFPELLN